MNPLDRMMQDVRDVDAEIGKALKERDRFKDALEEIVQQLSYPGTAREDVCQVAREALNG